MLTVEVTGSKQVVLTERPDPFAVRDYAVVRVQVAPMCTEYKAYKEGAITSKLGHEAAGMVEQVAQPGPVKAGDRVVVMPQYPCGKCSLCLAGDYIYCQHCVDLAQLSGSPWGTATYAQKLLKADWLLVPIPDDICTEHASMACCGLGPTFGAMQTMAIDRGETLLIAGMGPVGLGGVVNATHRGARTLAIESNAYRADLAKRLGAAHVFDPRDPDIAQNVIAATDGIGVDAALDCSGVAAAQRMLVDCTRRRGRVAFVGEAGEFSVRVSDDMIRKGLTLYGQWHYNLADIPNIMNVIRANASKLDLLITHRFPMSRVQEAFELQLTGACGKVLLDPWA